MKTSRTPRFFRTPAAFRAWLMKHHAAADELIVGFYKRDSGRPSITWPESVDAALSFGWIDGIRRSIDESSYAIRFTPRRSRSTWSAVNIRRARALIEAGAVRPAGLRAFEARRENRSGRYSYEQRPSVLPGAYARMLQKNAAAWDFFRNQPPFYRRAVTWWIISAKKEETRVRRAGRLAAFSARGLRIPEMRVGKRTEGGT